MLLQTTKRSPCGNLVARVSLCPEWQQYLVTVYKHGVQVSAHYRATRLQAEDDARGSVAAGILPGLQSVTVQQELNLVPMN